MTREPQDLPENVVAIHPSRPMSAKALSVWFAKLANRLAKHQMPLEPTAFALVLINPGKMRIYHRGFRSWALWEEAARALQNQFHYERDGARYPGLYPCPQQARRSGRSFHRQQARKQATYERDYPEACPRCSDRFKTAQGLRQHQRACRRRQGPPVHVTQPAPQTPPVLRLVQDGTTDA